MATSPEPSLLSSLPTSSDGVAVGLATTSGDGLIIVAAASETIAHSRNNGNDGDDGNEGEGAALSVAAASGTMTAAVTTLQWAIISSDAKSSLQAYVEEKEWPLNKTLSRGANFF
jgi:hypothetical protein